MDTIDDAWIGLCRVLLLIWNKKNEDPKTRLRTTFNNTYHFRRLRPWRWQTYHRETRRIFLGYLARLDCTNLTNLAPV